MKKLILFLTLLFVGLGATFEANAQYSPSNNLNYIKLLKTPPIGSVEDSVMVYDSSSSFVKMLPKSSIVAGKESILNKTSTISGYDTTLYPNEKATHDALDLKLNISDLPTNLTLYPTTTTSDVSGYVVMVKDIHDVRYNSTAVDVSTPTITGVGQLVSQRITDAGVLIGQPGVFNITTFGNIRRLSGSGTATFYFEVYHRDLSGVETLICTSSISNAVVNGTYAEFTASGVWDDGDFIATDRIVIKSYANRIAGGSDPVYQFQFGGVSPVRTLLPVPFSVVDAGYELKSNKQNDLTPDGTGTKYPTVDAVNNALSLKVSGSGSTNYIPKFTSGNSIGNSLLIDDGSRIDAGNLTGTINSSINDYVFNINNTLNNNTKRLSLFSTNSNLESTIANNTLGSRGIWSRLSVKTANTKNWGGIVALSGEVVTETGATGIISEMTGLQLSLGNASDGLTVNNVYGIKSTYLNLNKPTTNTAGLAFTKILNATNSTQLLLGTLAIPSGNYAIYDTTGYDSILSGNLTATSYIGGATLTGTPTAPTATVGTNTTQIATTAFAQGIRPYKVYTALLTQVGTNAPTAIVLENTIGAIVWSRSVIGGYFATLSEAFTTDKTSVLITNGSTNGTYIHGAQVSTSNVNVITPADGQIDKATIEIRVYN